LTVVDGTCRGATFVDRDGRLQHVDASATLIATGGGGQVYRETTNPGIATGDGVAIAFEAGARVVDLEFVQFHPTVLSVADSPRFLLSEALRGEGARLVNEAGERFVQRYEPAGDLASRDLVSRAIAREIQRTGAPVYLTMAHLDHEYVRRRFPTIAEACRQAGLDLATDRIPVSPAAHYMMGGIEADLSGRTSIARLFAAGEAACTGLHGANRLASNSLLEGLVFGARAADAMQRPECAAALFADSVDRVEPATGLPAASLGTDSAAAVGAKAEGRRAKVASGREIPDGVPATFAVRDLMWRCAGLSRTRAELERGVQMLAQWRAGVEQVRAQRPADREVRQLASLVTVGLLIARAALRREESRGGHYRSDFPQHDDARWKRHCADVLAR
jgi:L-aspartate oxidase